MCLWTTNAPGGNKVQLDIFLYKGHGQCHKVIDPGVLFYQSSMHAKYEVSFSCGSKIMVKAKINFPRRHTGQKLDAPKFHTLVGLLDNTMPSYI